MSWAYKIKTTIISVEEHFKEEYVSGSGKDAVFNRVSLGWFARMKGSYEALYLGKDKPEAIAGETVTITLAKA